jgi:predicted unusual protein kinase regulating ubiquinone biosynthesis (AarF/ABC1/UbiB family)
MADDRKKTTAVPSHRAHRLMHLGGLAAGIAGGMLAECARRMAKGELPDLKSLALTPDNAARLADKLSKMRGAAMKVGQLLSMEAGDVLPPEFTAVLAKLREDAHFMPIGQLADLLEREWGDGWEARFERFAFTPLAAASIGQVHEARLRDGRRLAIKIQYPGVRKSIDSDVDNVAGLLRLLRIFPAETQVQELLGEAKRQLHEEADYRREAGHIGQFRAFLADSPDFVLPEVVDALTTADVLAMTFVPGVPVESLATEDQALRDRVASAIIGLLFREFFEFGVVQTDPNFANYRYDAETGRLGLLDFGASRHYPAERMEGLRRLMAAAWRDDARAVEAEALAMGYLVETDSPVRRQAVADLFRAVCEPARSDGPYDFGASDLVARLRESSYAMGFEQGYWRAPPADLVFLHRKLAGLFLLAARLKARVDAGALLRPYLA